MPMTYVAADDRYDAMPYRRCGRSGLQLPAVSLGLWHNFGDDRPLETSARSCAARSTSASRTSTWPTTTGRRTARPRRTSAASCARTSRPYRDELIISTKAGYDMWPGPYGEWGSRKYLLASLDQSLQRMGLDYVDIFYSHRFDPDTPLEETMGALDTRGARRARRCTSGISSYSAQRTAEAARILRDLGTPLLIHQPSYSMLNRWIEEDLLDVLEQRGRRLHRRSRRWPRACSPTSTSTACPPDSRAGASGALLRADMLTEENLAHVRALNEIAERARPVAGADGDRVDAARPARDLRADRRVAACASSRTTSPRSTTSTSPTTSSPRSTGTRSTPASTSGAVVLGVGAAGSFAASPNGRVRRSAPGLGRHLRRRAPTPVAR